LGIAPSSAIAKGRARRPRILCRQRVLAIAGETWKKRLIARGVRV
jgi:hypothetical protein